MKSHLSLTTRTLLIAPEPSTPTSPSFFRRISTSSEKRELNSLTLITSLSALRDARLNQVKAEKASRAKTDFLMNVSHEIRTPLSAILGLTQILLTTQLDEKQKKCLDIMQSSSEALLVIVNGLLDIDKIESENQAIDHTAFRLFELLTQIVTLMQVKANEKNVGLTLRYEARSDQDFIGDSGRIRQILVNLIGNAIKFTERGEITVSCSSKDIGDGNREIFISVADTGIGIPQEKITAIFGRFAQADASIRPTYGGTGLGLTISKALAEDLGGEIMVNSTLGNGSVFTLHIQMPKESSHHETSKDTNAHFNTLDSRGQWQPCSNLSVPQRQEHFADT